MRARYINESENSGIISFHTSPAPLHALDEYPMWFTISEDLAKAYHENALEDDDAFTYRVLIEGRVLSMAEAGQIAEEAGMDFYELTSDLASNPTSTEIKEIVDEFKNICDGFYMPDYDPRDAYLQAILMSIYYDHKEIGAKTGVSELVESNIGVPYYTYKQLIGYDKNLLYNKELPKELHGGGFMWGVDTKAKRKEYCVTNGLKECIINYHENMDYDIIFTQLDTYIPVKTGAGYSYKPADSRLYKDDVLDSLSFSYIASKVCTRIPTEIGNSKEVEVRIRQIPHHDKMGNYYLKQEVVNG